MVTVIFLATAPVWSQEEAEAPADGAPEAGAPDAAAAEAAEDEQSGREMTPGFIFNASNLLLDLNAYQGGVGGKLDFGDYALRALLSFQLANSQAESTQNDIDLTLGIAAEFPFFQGRVSPYWGGFIDGTVTSEKRESAAGDVSSTLVLSGSVGPLLGAELAIFDFLSAFAEYQLSFGISRTTTEDEATDTSDETTNYNLATELGNAGSLGIVIYLKEKPMDESIGLRGAGDDGGDEAAGDGDAE
jgi:hypothetical protein